MRGGAVKPLNIVGILLVFRGGIGLLARAYQANIKERETVQDEAYDPYKGCFSRVKKKKMLLYDQVDLYLKRVHTLTCT